MRYIGTALLILGLIMIALHIYGTILTTTIVVGALILTIDSALKKR